MKLGYVISQYPMRSLTFIRREMATLRARGVDLRVYSLRKCPPHEVLDEEDAREFRDTCSVLPIRFGWFLAAHLGALAASPRRYVQVLMLAWRCRPPQPGGSWYALFYFAEGVALARCLRQDGIDRVHVHFGNAGAHVANVACALLELPWGVSYHGTADFDYPNVGSLPWQIARARFVRCISYYTLSQALRLAPRGPRAELFVAYVGLRNPASLPQRARGPLAAPPRLIAVGRLSAEKGQYLLLQALREVRAAGADFSLMIVGDGPDRAGLEELALASGIAAQCRFTGAVTEDEVHRMMGESDILLCPSLMEGLPVVLMEAMAAGLPVVAPRIAGIPELVEDGVTGLLYAPADQQGFAAAILRLLRDAALCERLVDAGRARVLRDFAIETTIEPLLARLHNMR